jgi:DNA-binding response OmpR family regulator
MRWRILVIDDDAGVRETIKQTLDERGYEVITAENGALGLAASRRSRPDPAITDIVLPVREGLQTIRELRRERPDLPITAISAGDRAARHDFLEIARQLGVWEIVVKPFDLDEFAALSPSCDLASNHTVRVMALILNPARSGLDHR